MDIIRKVLEVKANDDFTLECEMENGEVYLYDMSFIHEKDWPMTRPLRKLSFFKEVFIECGCVTWPNGFNTDGDSIVIRGELIKKSA
ncbi:MAG: DUF2442 domain-containing protein [Halobacteriovoraceae bacterium]|nr:DUF2442 domain-containing protein [Halobacteriovoraceae bacterium]